MRFYTNADIKAIRADIKDLRKEMKENNVKVTSCFNGGLSRYEYQCNCRLFQLKTELETARA